MKKLLMIIALPLSLYSCTKCGTCTRTWEYHSYQISSSGSITNKSDTDGATETFDVCGSEDIENAEKPIRTHSETKISNTQTIISDGTGSCNCVTK